MMGITKKGLAIFMGSGIVIGLLGALFWYNTAKKEIKNNTPELPEINLEAIKGKDNLVPFLVLGSGPASLAAALYGARTKVRTVVLKGPKPGGQLTGTSYIENWPGIRKIRGMQVVADCEEQAARFGAVMINDSAKMVDLTQWPYVVTTNEGLTLHAMSLFVGTGSTPRGLGIPGEQEYWGHGVTTCAICDAPYHKGDTVVVVGGGDSAVEEVLELSSYAKEVKMVIRTDTMKASPSMIERLDTCNNVSIYFNTSLTEIVGTDGKVSSVNVINNKTKETEHWDDVKGVFLAIGHTPNTAILQGQLETDRLGYIKIKNRTQHTSREGVFAAGDVADPRYKQAGVAAGDGIKAGLDATWWLGKIGFEGNIIKDVEPFFFEPHVEELLPIQQINSVEEFKAIAKRSGDKLVIIDFYTPFCPSCLQMMPIVQWIGTKLESKLLFLKVDASIAFDLVKEFKAPKVPYFIVTQYGKIIGRCDDVMDKVEMYHFVKKYLK